MTWVRLDPTELAVTGAHLRALGLAYVDAASRVRAVCCGPGLGRHAGPLMAEGEAVAATITRVTEDYLRQAVDILLRAVVALRDQQLVSSLGGVGTVSTAIIGGTYVGGHSWSDGITIGGSSSSVVGGFVLGEVGPTTSVVGGPATVGGFVLAPSSLTAVVGGPTTVGGTYLGGGGAMAGGIMALAGAAQRSQERSAAIIARLQAGQGVATGVTANQGLGDWFTRQAMDRIRDSEIRTAASSPIAGYAEARAADATDFGGRARALDNERHLENQRTGRNT